MIIKAIKTAIPVKAVTGVLMAILIPTKAYTAIKIKGSNGNNFIL